MRMMCIVIKFNYFIHYEDLWTCCGPLFIMKDTIFLNGRYLGINSRREGENRFSF